MKKTKHNKDGSCQNTPPPSPCREADGRAIDDFLRFLARMAAVRHLQSTQGPEPARPVSATRKRRPRAKKSE